jgi:hypothetical protein
MAFNGVDEGPLAWGLGPEGSALAGGGEHLASQDPMLFLLIGVKCRKGRLEINSRNRFPGFPQRFEAGEHRMGPTHLGLPALDPQIKAIKNKAGTGEGFQPSQIGF